MSPIKHSTSLILVSCILLFSSIVHAHNITRILEQDKDFSTFNDLLSKTNLAQEINRRKTITILAVANEQLGDLPNKALDVMKTILQEHIVLDYYDILKLQQMKGRSSILTTLYQTTGVASYGQGFLNVTETPNGEIIFGSSVKGAARDSKYLGTIASRPFNISVLSVSHVIVAPGIDGTPLRPVAPAPKQVGSAPPMASEVPPPAESPEEAEAPAADGPVSEDDDVSESPVDSPASSPTPAEAPAADAADDKAETKKSSAGKQLGFCSFAFLLVLGTSLLVQY